MNASTRCAGKNRSAIMPTKNGVQVAVGAAGKPVIKQVFLDGKPYAEAMRQQKQP